MPVLDTLAAVIPMLGILIVVHELGHFLAAKACGVRVLRFSIGFGTPIGFGKLRAYWERGGTEYVIGWIPLGGFVRMLGENMPGDDAIAMGIPADARRDEFLDAKPLWQKLAVVFAGPAMNLLLPIVCLVGILWVGFPQAAPVIGSIEEGSPAALAGLRVDDRIVAIDGKRTTFWEEVVEGVRTQDSAATAQIEILRGAERQTIPVPVVHQKTRDRYGSVVDAGWIGVSHRRRAALLGVPDGQSAAVKAGIRSGDLVVAVGETEIEDWEGLRVAHAAAVAAAREAGRSQVEWTIERTSAPAEATGDGTGASTERRASDEQARADEEPGADDELASNERPDSGEESNAEAPATETHAVGLPLESDLAALGLIPATILVGQVSPDKPAALAGIRAGDLILFVDGRAVGSFESFVSQIQTSHGRPLELTYSRDGRVERLVVSPREEKVPGPYAIEGLEEKVYQIGIAPALATLPGAVDEQRMRNPLESIPRATSLAWTMTADFLVGLSKLFTGEVGTEKLQGPIGIARIARKSLDEGWLDYLFMMMLISINLAFVNLLPIPILDGGQAVLYSIEGIKRAPLSLRTREITTSIGFALIALLMGRAFWNDLTPFWRQFVDWLSRSPS